MILKIRKNESRAFNARDLMVAVMGFEPINQRYTILSRARLPVSPHRHLLYSLRCNEMITYDI